VSDRLVSVLLTHEMGDATRALSWLRQRDDLPHALASLLVSLEYVVGRVWVDECYSDAEAIVKDGGKA
jgi:hypothetical protein